MVELTIPEGEALRRLALAIAERQSIQRNLTKTRVGEILGEPYAPPADWLTKSSNMEIVPIFERLIADPTSLPNASVQLVEIDSRVVNRQ